MSRRCWRAGWLRASVTIAALLVITPTLHSQSAVRSMINVRASASADTIRLDLARAVQIAIDSATPVQLGQDSVRLSGIALLESYGRFLPSVTTSIGAFNQSGTALLSSTALLPADAQFYGLAYQLSASVNLFNGFRDREHMRAALRDRVAANEGLDRARQQVAFDATQAFYQVVLDRRLSAVARANLELSRAREAQLAEQVRIGTRAPPDLYRQQAQTRADEAAVIDADNRVENDQTTLLRRLRLDPLRSYDIVEPAPDTTALSPEALRVAALVPSALRARPDLAAANDRTAADESELRAAKGELLPRLDLTFAFATTGRVFGHEIVDGTNQLTVQQRPFLQQLGDQHVGVLSLGLSWDLLDRYRARLGIERATAANDRDRLSTQDLQLRIAGEVQQAVGDYRAAEQKLTSSAAGLEAAQQAFDAVQGRFDVGLASFVDVLSAQTALTQARALREQAVTNIAFQKAVLRYALGQRP